MKESLQKSCKVFVMLVLALGLNACKVQGQRMSEGKETDPFITGSMDTSTEGALNPDPGYRQGGDDINDQVTRSRENAITRAVRKVSPAVVGINVTEVREVRYRDPFDGFFDDPFFRRFFGSRRPRSYKQEVHGLGSGFLISPDGYIVTNDHVVGSASKIIVTMTDGKQFDARVIGSDPTSDVALVKIEGKDLPYLPLEATDNIMIGEWVIALGNPFGLFDINSKPTVTVGVVSNADVNLRPVEGRVYRDMIQTDAAISSGNSGGPLVNAMGQLVGMNSTIYSTAQSYMGAGSIGIGFAVPVKRVAYIVNELREHGGIDRNYWTGMRIQQIDANIARYLKLDDRDGVVVVEIARNSPASRSGLKVGDVIVAIDGENVRNEDDALLYLGDARVGQSMRLLVEREGNQQELVLTLTKRGE